MHPKTKKQVKATNKPLRKLWKLAQEKEAWVNELSDVLWAYKTTLETATREMQFTLAFDHEIVVHTESGMITSRMKYFDKEKNNE